jgi:pimeloyl-ACP methyl ester carboxylesterase
MQTVIFLPGALGAAEFWHPVGDLLPEEWRKVYVAWPGLGAQAPDESIRDFDDLVRLVEVHLTEESALVAQSMGGIVAIRVALRNAARVRRLVLVATSGGLDVASFGGADWRPGYRADHPTAATWITEDRPDHTEEIPLITAPTLLLWGDRDPISPIAVGEHLAALLPNAILRVIAGGTHSLASDHAHDVATQILEHLCPSGAASFVSKADPATGAGDHA